MLSGLEAKTPEELDRYLGIIDRDFGSEEALRSRAFQRCGRSGDGRAALREPEGLRSDLERGDGAERLPAGRKAECFLRPGETVSRDEGKRLHFQHDRADRIDARPARLAPLDSAATARGAQDGSGRDVERRNSALHSDVRQLPRRDDKQRG